MTDVVARLVASDNTHDAYCSSAATRDSSTLLIKRTLVSIPILAMAVAEVVNARRCFNDGSFE